MERTSPLTLRAHPGIPMPFLVEGVGMGNSFAMIFAVILGIASVIAMLWMQYQILSLLFVLLSAIYHFAIKNYQITLLMCIVIVIVIYIYNGVKHEKELANTINSKAASPEEIQIKIEIENIKRQYINANYYFEKIKNVFYNNGIIGYMPNANSTPSIRLSFIAVIFFIDGLILFFYQKKEYGRVENDFSSMVLGSVLIAISFIIVAIIYRKIYKKHYVFPRANYIKDLIIVSLYYKHVDVRMLPVGCISDIIKMSSVAFWDGYNSCYGAIDNKRSSGISSMKDHIDFISHSVSNYIAGRHVSNANPIHKILKKWNVAPGVASRTPSGG